MSNASEYLWVFYMMIDIYKTSVHYFLTFYGFIYYSKSTQQTATGLKGAIEGTIQQQQMVNAIKYYYCCVHRVHRRCCICCKQKQGTLLSMLHEGNLIDSYIFSHYADLWALQVLSGDIISSQSDSASQPTPAFQS